MAKVVVKYLTKPTNEVMAHINKYNKDITSDDIKEFLATDSNFCLMIFVFNKLNSLIFIKNNEYSHHLIIDSIYMNEYVSFKECVSFLENKFVNYKIVIDSSFKDKNFLSVVKKNGGILKDNNYIIQL